MSKTTFLGSNIWFITSSGLKMIKLIVLLLVLVGLSSSTPMDMSALAVQRDSGNFDNAWLCLDKNAHTCHEFNFSGQEHHLWIYKLVPVRHRLPVNPMVRHCHSVRSVCFPPFLPSSLWIHCRCCFPKTPTGGPCFGPGIGTSCANGACLERFPFGKIFLWPPSALSK